MFSNAVAWTKTTSMPSQYKIRKWNFELRKELCRVYSWCLSKQLPNVPFVKGTHAFAFSFYEYSTVYIPVALFTKTGRTSRYCATYRLRTPIRRSNPLSLILLYQPTYPFPSAMLQRMFQDVISEGCPLSKRPRQTTASGQTTSPAL